MGHDPLLRIAASALPFLGADAAKSTPFADCEFGFTEELRDIGRRIVLLFDAFREQYDMFPREKGPIIQCASISFSLVIF